MRTIPATISRRTETPSNSVKKKRVAGYARVSTDHEDQVSSYEAQVAYYTEYIKGRDDWEFAGIYTDEGISATNTKRREGFKQMVADAIAGKIDLIVTKSVSRFARNTVDSLTTVRKLRDKGIEVYFEKENIRTLDAKGELLITIMSSLAQEESRSISENTTWGQRRRFANGKASVAYGRFLGYDRGFSVNEEQAKTVRLIYKLFLDGLSCYTIAKELTRRELPTPGGGKTWNQSTVRSILTNEKYKGDALLQKEFTVDFLQKKLKKNEGEIPQYYVEGNHKAIIDPEIFDHVQAEMAKRKKQPRTSGVSIFSSKIRCGDCQNWYGAKIWHSTDAYRRTVYRCNHKYRNGKVCGTPHITEDEIKDIFVRAVNLLLVERDEIVSNMRTLMDTLCGHAELETRKTDLRNEMEEAAALAEQCVHENARIALDQSEYAERYEQLAARYENAKAAYGAVMEEIAEKGARKKLLEDFIHILSAQPVIAEFEAELWASLVDYVTVYSKEDIRVTFRDGTEIQV